jgi:citrate synthase
MKNGLDDVIAAETVLSHVDGEGGRLIVRGHDIEALAGKAAYEDVVALLWSGIVRDVPMGDALRTALGAARVAAFERLQPLLPFAVALTPIEATRFLVGAIGDGEALAGPVGMLATVGVAAALAMRLGEGRAPVRPDAARGHAADLLRMIRGHEGDAAEVAALEAYLVTIVDHGLNASTFAARVVASTAAGLPSALVAAVSALKGPLHGGAPGPVLDMLDAIGSEEAAEAWLTQALDRGERLMGFGHRVYRVRDPRADVLKTAVRTLRGRANRIALAESVERQALALLAQRKAGRRLDVNVEFYTALLLEALGIPRAGFTALFAAGRAAGWIAHVREQEAGGRIMRPQSRYVGPMPASAA